MLRSDLISSTYPHLAAASAGRREFPCQQDFQPSLRAHRRAPRPSFGGVIAYTGQLEHHATRPPLVVNLYFVACQRETPCRGA
jgi:hypothetical protein